MSDEQQSSVAPITKDQIPLPYAVVFDSLTMEIERLRNAIRSFGNDDQFDWKVLDRIDQLEDENERLCGELEELNSYFELRRAADRRATKAWQEKHGKPMSLPSHDDLCGYLMEELEKYKADAERLDWCQEYFVRVRMLPDESFYLSWFDREGRYNETKAETLRAAIDAAMGE